MPFRYRGSRRELAVAQFVRRHYALVQNNHHISSDEFHRLVQPLVGLPVSRAWRGYGSAAFLELGKLTEVYERTKRPKGEAGVMIQWSWRVESARAIVVGSWCGDRKITHGVEALAGRKIEGISLVGRLPEVSIRLSGGRWLHSFMTADGQPTWSVFLPDGSWLCVRRGYVVREHPKKREQKNAA